MAGYEGDVAVQIFTSNGRLVRTENRKVAGDDLQLDLSGLPKGIYYLGIQKAGAKEIFKLIKK